MQAGRWGGRDTGESIIWWEKHSDEMMGIKTLSDKKSSKTLLLEY